MVLHTAAGTQASAPFANPVRDGRSVRLLPAATELFVLIYAQVVQSDGAAYRNVLLSRKPAAFGKPLSCLAVETVPGGSPFPDPLGADLGLEPLLRSSPLVPVPAICGV